ncbi:MAG: ABC transporter substrate-binding protein [Arachnia sp.]
MAEWHRSAVLRSAAVGVLLLGLAGCSTAPEGDASTQALTVAHYPNNMITISLDIAEREGFFDAEGLTVETIDVAKGPEAIAGLIGGSTQIAWATPATFIPAAAQGQDLVALPPFMDLDYVIYVPEDSDIETVEDLRGRKIGVNALGGAVHTFALEVLKPRSTDGMGGLSAP